MTRRLTSPISEHSAELALVPAFSKALANVYAKIVPLYFWLSREGGLLARTIHEHEEFEAVALFPRRPKFSMADDEQIVVTVNPRVLMAAEILEARGIPSVCGCPRVRSFWELGDQPNCAFVGLSNSTADEYVFDLDSDVATPDTLVLRSHMDLVRFIKASTRKQNLEKLILAVRESRAQWGGHLYGRHMLIAGYKPVIVLLKP